MFLKFESNSNDVALCGNCVSILNEQTVNPNLDLWRHSITSLSLLVLCDLGIMLPLSQFFFVKNEVE